MEKSDAAMKDTATAEASQATDNPRNAVKKPIAKIEVAKKTQPKAKRALPGTKKRKAKALEKSTTTTTTAAAATPVNVYDAVLGEAEDLLQAAAEARALGRLKMASAYQLLLHARLVGLGRRFDSAQVQGPVPQAAGTSAAMSVSTTGTAGSSPPSESTPDALHSELAKMLPQNVEIDSAMMEHLARAAMELHHQRTGRRIASDNITEPPPKPPPNTPSIVWTEQERNQVQRALAAGNTNPTAIASQLKTRTEAQVKAFLRNSEERQKGSAQMEEEFTSDLASPRRRGGRGRKPPTQAMNTVPNAKLDAKSLVAGKGM
jgi:hypothetical protein